MRNLTKSNNNTKHKKTNNKEKIHEFNFKAAKNKEFFYFKYQNVRTLALCGDDSNYWRFRLPLRAPLSHCCQVILPLDLA
jgi:hypothetical protein